MSRSFAIPALAAAFAGLAIAAVPAAAQDARSVEVRFQDLDLTSAKDVERLNRRIGFAVNTACGIHGARSLQEISRAHECKAEALAKAQRAVEVAVAERSGARLASVQ